MQGRGGLAGFVTLMIWEVVSVGGINNAGDMAERSLSLETVGDPINLWFALRLLFDCSSIAQIGRAHV